MWEGEKRWVIGYRAGRQLRAEEGRANKVLSTLWWKIRSRVSLPSDTPLSNRRALHKPTSPVKSSINHTPLTQYLTSQQVTVPPWPMYKKHHVEWLPASTNTDSTAVASKKTH